MRSVAQPLPAEGPRRSRAGQATRSPEPDTAPPSPGEAQDPGEASRPWRRVLTAIARSPLLLCAAGGAVAVQLSLALSPAGDLGWALRLGARVAIGFWAARTVLGVVVAVAPRRAGTAPAVEATRWRDWQIVLAGAALLVAGTLRAPGRLIANVLGFGIVALVTLWMVRRSGGARASAQAAAVLAVLALVPLTVDQRAVPSPVQALPDSPYRWPVGWPGPEWVLRQEILLPADATPARWLDFLLLRPYNGPARVLARVNGEDAGQLVSEGHGNVLRLAIPEHVARGPVRLSVELRQSPADPDLKLIAQTWSAGATLGDRASSYYDGETWWPGTFVEATGTRRRGVYVLEVRSER